MRAAGSGTGAAIGVGFGLAFVIINTALMPPGLRVAMILAAVAALVAILWLAFARRDSSAPGRSPFGWRYWLVVLVEVLALIGGTRVLDAMGRPDLGVAWVSFVVGTHFFALGALFRLRRFHVLAALVTACSVCAAILGLLVGPAAAPGVAVLGGIAPGFLLLAFGLWAVWPVPERKP